MARILVIDDEPALRRMLSRALASAGHFVLEAQDGRAGLGAIQEHHPDLVLCDVNMPEMSGFELLQAVRAQPGVAEEMPFIFLSALSERQDMIAGRRLGADDYLTKPLDLDLVLASVEARLERYRNRLERLNHAANHDFPTGLPNRKRLCELIEARHPAVAAIHLDIDQFRKANTIAGRAGGDQALGLLVERLSAAIKPGETLGRVGDDEFILLTSPAEVPERAEALARRFAEPITVAGHRLSFTASIGYASGEHAAGAVELLQHAELASRAAKARGGNRRQAFSLEMAAVASRRVAIEIDLASAVAKGELFLLYQPKVHLETGRIVGAEALARWRSPALGEVSPLEFIEQAEQSGLIAEIGLWALREACDRIGEIKAVDAADFRMAVNLSPRQFESAGLVDAVGNVFAETAIAPGDIEFEVTETVLAADTARAIEVLRDLRGLGATIAIDDFGTGYSSLSYLSQFPVNTLKIDQVFLRGIPGNTSDESIIDAILNLAQGLRLTVVAEGVENAAQAAFLRQRGCLFGQGYHFARPLTVAELKERLAQQAMRKSQAAGGP